MVSNYIHISHHLALIATQNFFSYLISVDPITKKNENAPNDPKVTLNVTGLKVHHICTTSTYESISFRFALRSLFFQIIEVFTIVNLKLSKIKKKH